MFAQNYSKNWLYHSIVCIFIIILCQLGNWQWHKFQIQQKLDLFIVKHQENIDITKIQLQNLPITTTIFGKLLAHKSIILLQQMYKNTMGCHILTPFLLTKTKHIIFVDRGWQIQKLCETTAKQNISRNNILLHGQLNTYNINRIANYFDRYVNHWPQKLLSINFVKLQKYFNQPILPFIFNLYKNDKYCLQCNSVNQKFNLKAAKYRGYAIQWWLMALSLTLLYLINIFKQQ